MFKDSAFASAETCTLAPSSFSKALAGIDAMSVDTIQQFMDQADASRENGSLLGNETGTAMVQGQGMNEEFRQLSCPRRSVSVFSRCRTQSNSINVYYCMLYRR